MITQRTPEWYQVRLGVVTGSNMHKIMGTLKNGERTAAWNTYQAELLAERMADKEQSNYTTQPMQWGVDHEAEAIEAYEIERLERVNPGYWVDAGTWGCTPDGFVGEDGVIDTKCPMSKTMTFQRFFAGDDITQEYYWQAMAALAATKLTWFDLVYYDPRFKRPEDRLFIRRIERDEEAIGRMLAAIAEFNAEMDEKLAAIGFVWTRHRFPDEAPLAVSEHNWHSSSTAEASVDELLALLTTNDAEEKETGCLTMPTGETIAADGDASLTRFGKEWKAAFQDLRNTPSKLMETFTTALSDASIAYDGDEKAIKSLEWLGDFARKLVELEGTK